MSLLLNAGPTAEPITTAEAKAFARIDLTADDALIATLITACRQSLDGRDGWLGRALLSQTWDLKLDAFPAVIRLPLAPVASVTHIKYLDTAGVEQTLAASQYRTDLVTEPARIEPAYGVTWPSTYSVINAVEVRSVYGYGAAAAVPEGIKLGLKALVAHYYAQREPVSPGALVEVPNHVEALLAPYRVWPLEC